MGTYLWVEFEALLAESALGEVLAVFGGMDENALLVSAVGEVAAAHLLGVLLLFLLRLLLLVLLLLRELARTLLFMF